jgi:hypothetical protein
MARSALLRTIFGLSRFAVVALLTTGCSRAPDGEISLRRLEGPRQPHFVLRCEVQDLQPPIHYQWRFSPSVKTVGNVPTTEAATLVSAPEPPSGLFAECTATDANNRMVQRSRALAVPAIGAAPASARVGELISVRGSGFGPSRNPGDALWFVPPRGAARAADHACKGASWADAVITACVPPSVRGGRWQLRVQAADDLGLAPTPTAVAP